MNRRLDYLYILATIAFTVYGQLIFKWRIAQFKAPPEALVEKLRFLLGIIFDPAIFSGFLSAFLASLAWMAAMTKFELSHAYPFTSLNFVIVLLLSGLILGEPITQSKMTGVILIVLGTMVIARG